MNQPGSIAWLVLFGVAFLALVLTIDLIRERIKLRRIQKSIDENDRNVIQAAQEAYRDFS